MADNKFHWQMTAEDMHEIVRWRVETYVELGSILPDDENAGMVARVAEDGSLHVADTMTGEGITWRRIDNVEPEPPVPLSDTPPVGVRGGEGSIAGEAAEAARADHRHALGSLIEWDVFTLTAITPVEGDQGKIARVEIDGNISLYMLARDTGQLYWMQIDSEHVAALSSSEPDMLDAVTDATAGAATEAARADHRHAISTDAPVAVGNANALGQSSALARADHVHDASSKADVSWVQTQLNGMTTIGTGTPSDVDPNVGASSGAANTAAPFDHHHSVATAAPVAVGAANAVGVSSALARADHVHDASGLRLPIITWVGWTNGESAWADIADPAPLGDVALVDGWLHVSIEDSPMAEAAQWKQLAYQADVESALTDVESALIGKAPLLVPTRTITAATATLALGDVGGSLLCDRATQQTITVPSMASVAIPVGAMILIVQLGIGSVVIAAGDGVTLRSSAQAPLQTRAQYAPPISLWKIAGDTWLVSGGLY